MQDGAEPKYLFTVRSSASWPDSQPGFSSKRVHTGPRLRGTVIHYCGLLLLQGWPHEWISFRKPVGGQAAVETQYLSYGDYLPQPVLPLRMVDASSMSLPSPRLAFLSHTVTQDPRMEPYKPHSGKLHGSE